MNLSVKTFGLVLWPIDISAKFKKHCFQLDDFVNNERRGTAMAIDDTNILATPGLSLPFLKVLAENSFDSILITDNSKDGKILYANKAFKKLTGHDPSEVIGKTPRILQGAGTDAKVTDRLRDALKTGGKFEGKAINYKKDGTPFIMYWRVLPIKVGRNIEAWIAIQREGASI